MRINFKFILRVVLVISILANIVLSYLVITDTQRHLFLTNLLSTSDDTTQLLKKVAEIVELPAEKPSVIVIEKVEVLQTQNPQFYANAADGDIVVIFSDRALIYRPTIGKLINFASINRL